MRTRQYKKLSTCWPRPASGRGQQDMPLSARSTARLLSAWKVKLGRNVGSGINWQSKFCFDNE